MPPPKKVPKEKVENRHTEPDGLIIRVINMDMKILLLICTRQF